MAVHRHSGVRLTGAFAIVMAVVIAAAGSGRGATRAAPVTVVAKIKTGQRPCLAAPVRAGVWVSNYGSSTLVRINPATNRVVGRRIRVGFQPCGLAYGAGSVWVDGYGTGRVERVDIRRARVTKRIRVGLQPWDVQFIEGSVWVTNSLDGSVSRIDPRRNRVVRTIRTGGSPANITRVRRRLDRLDDGHADLSD